MPFVSKADRLGVVIIVHPLPKQKAVVVREARLSVGLPDEESDYDAKSIALLTNGM